ncbi:DEAD/DEAH box helicase family protein [Streptomyces europaeiscabiei]|uniref:DEAD/DEAH box helicase family protein n=1 Tax=Streptomyces europaeiscabiei TaxID=146819 RepID=UPI0029BA6353|nr:DEAD/DEAH box helicase family protein [Streptomyces europaeiscabiei]MDX3585734.1 DEAD/DEAH box helicase family protein [Streptomyces europaeiscabiei]MDX3635988.1 DEAD/DEAH box helicase family protein [Streptomyces europaeiscabiei]MDX3654064.1 DEAD/DEAH box helicase family protein [Streptomyces europaeiscabiei]
MAAARQFGEILAAEVGHRTGVRLPAGDQPARLDLLSRAGVLVPQVLDAFNDLHRFDGGTREGREAAAYLVERCFMLAAWFFRALTGDAESMNFVHTAASDLSVLAQRVAALEEDLPRLRREYDLRVSPVTLAVAEREQLIVSARDAAHEPLRESDIAAEVQRRLAKAGWDVLGAGEETQVNRSLGCVLVEPRLAGGRRADMLLTVGGQVVGIVECKRDGTDLTDAMEQAGALANAPAGSLPWPVWRSPLPYRYVSDGRRLLFCDANDPEPQARLVSGFHQPRMLARWQREAEADGAAPTYRARQAAYLLRQDEGFDQLRNAQHGALRAIEQALAAGQRRALVHMATGSGRSFTGVFTAYRQLRYARAGRVLFVADRKLAVDQLIAQLRQFSMPDGGRPLEDVYHVQELTADGLAPSASVAVATVQRLSAMLAGTPTPEDGSDRVSAYETAERHAHPDATPLEVAYCEALPPDAFDLVIVDDCHRALYGQRRALLEYFDAPIVGFSAAPTATALGFFKGNLVDSYTYEQAVADGVAVDYSVYEIRVADDQQPAFATPVDAVGVKAHSARRARYEDLDEELASTAGQSPARAVPSEHLTAVVTAFRDALPTLFPDRTQQSALGVVPKTVVLTQDGPHADEVVERIRDVFGAGDVFCRRITHRDAHAVHLLREFRTTPQFRIAVVTDLISGVSDMRAIECLLILREVRSAAYYQQLLAMGTQTIASAELRAVTPGAVAKTQLVVVDAVGASRHLQPLVNVTDASGQAGRAAVERLLHRAANGLVTPQQTAELAIRLARLIPALSDADGAEIRKLAGQPLQELVTRLLDSVDSDHLAPLRRAGGKRAVEDERRAALFPLAENPELQETLLGLYDRPAPLRVTVSSRRRREAETVRGRLAEFIERAGPFSSAQLWWIEKIADVVAAETRFAPAYLDSIPFSARGGTDGFLDAFGPDAAIDLLDELRRALA